MDRRFYFRILVLSVAVVVVASSCINKDYDIKTDEIDMGVQLAPNGLSIPIGFIDQKTLGQIIGDNDLFSANEQTGDYSIRYDSVISYSIDPITVDPITFNDLANLFRPVTVSPEGDGNQLPSSVAIQGKTMSIPVSGQVPSFDMSDGTQIEGLNLTSNGSWPGGYGPGQSVPAGQTFEGSVTSSSNAIIEIDVTLPDAVKSVETVWLKDANGPNTDKAAVTIALNLNGLEPVTNSVTIKEFTVLLPSRYTIEAGNYPGATVTPISNNSFKVENYTLTGAKEIVFYINSLVFTPSDIENSAISKNEPFSYSIDYSITTKAGTIGQTAPAAHITGNPAFSNAKFTTNEIEFKTDPYTYVLDQTVTGFNNAVEEVTKVAFKSPNELVVTIPPLNLPAVFENQLPVTVTFPATFDLEMVSSGGVYANNTLTAPVSAFNSGFRMAFKGINFPNQTGVPVNGAIAIKGDISAGVDHTFGVTTLMWSDIPHDPIPDPIDVAIADMDLALDIDNSEFTLNAVTKEVEGEGTINETFDVPDVITKINEVAVEAVNSTRVEMTLSLDIVNPLVDEFYLDDFTIDLPDFIIVDTEAMSFGPNQSFDPETNVYKDKLITVSGTSAELVKLYIKGLRAIPVDLNTFIATLKGDFKYSATVRTPQGFEPAQGQADMTITPRLDITDIKVTSLEGMFNLKLEDYIGDKIDPISLKDIFDVIGSANQTPDLAPPVIELEISNPVGINLLGAISIKPLDGDDQPLGDIEVNQLRIDPATGQTATTTKLYITNGGATSAPAGYIGVDANLSGLVSTIPHTIEIGVSGNVNPDQNLINTIAIGRKYDFEMGYKVEVPLAFGPDMSLTLEHTAEDLNGTFSELAEYRVKASQIKVFAEMTVSFPLKLEGVNVEMLDKEGQAIEGLTSTVSGVIAGPVGNNAPQTSTLQIDLVVPDGGDFTALSKVDKLQLKVPIKSTDGSDGYNNKLNSADYVRGRLWIELSKGISADLKNLLKNSGSDGNDDQQ